MLFVRARAAMNNDAPLNGLVAVVLVTVRVDNFDSISGLVSCGTGLLAATIAPRLM